VHDERGDRRRGRTLCRALQRDALRFQVSRDLIVARPAIALLRTDVLKKELIPAAADREDLDRALAERSAEAGDLVEVAAAQARAPARTVRADEIPAALLRRRPGPVAHA